MSKAKTWTESAFEIKASTIPNAGKGLFAKREIEVEDTIGYYTGEVIDEHLMEQEPYSGSKYLLWVTKRHIIYGEGPKSNYTRYINHSSNPNAYLTVSTRWKTARLEAIRNIRAGEEIFFDYGESYWGNQEEAISEAANNR